jgi:hypothetical protein
MESGGGVGTMHEQLCVRGLGLCGSAVAKCKPITNAYQSVPDFAFRYIYIKHDISNTIQLTQPQSKSNEPNAYYTVQENPFYGIYNNLCSAPLPAPIAPSTGGEHGLGVDRAVEITKSTGIQYPLFDDVADYADKKYLYGLLLSDQEFRESEDELAEFYIAAQTTNIKKLYELEQTLALLADSTIAHDSTARDSLLQAAAVLEASIASTKLHEQGEKWIGNVTGRVVLEGIASLSSAEHIQLAVLANSCPAALGPAVYKARALHSILHPAAQYADQQVCAAYLSQNKNSPNLYLQEDANLNIIGDGSAATSGSADAVLYPNPVHAGGKLTVQLPRGAAPYSIQLCDATGIVVFSASYSTNRAIIIPLPARLSAGIYAVIIRDDTGHTNIWKVAVQ